jgi:dienelactone hydrolase
MIHKQFIITSREGEKMRADLRYEANGAKKPVVIFVHGFKGFKNWGPFPAVCEKIAASGFISIAFNLSHNGVGDDLMNFTELDRFAENTFSRELDELGDVINEIIMLKNIPIEESEIHSDAIGILGHSRGGSLAILEAPRHRAVRAVTAWSAPSYFNRYTERQMTEWRKDGHAEIQNSRTGQTMRLNVSLLDDIEKNRGRLNIPISARALTSQEKGLLVIAGTEDLTVKPIESQEIYDAALKQFSELHIISNTGHTFGAEFSNPAIPAPMENALDFTLNFFSKYLVQHPIPFPE